MIPVPQLSKGDFSDWEDISRSFASSPTLSMKQAWLGEGKYDGHFRPCEVRPGWFGDRVLVYARLEDEEIHSDSTEDNQQLWNLGDVFEIFIRDSTRQDYREFHVNPNNHRLQLLFPSTKHFLECRDIAPYIVAEPLFDFRIRAGAGAWEVFVSIPFHSINPDAESPFQRTAFASFSRYDRSSGKPPVLSSTSPHAVLSFHRQEEWSELYFQ